MKWMRARGRAKGQRVFHFRTWGGARSGAGRKPNGRRSGVSHLRRPAHAERHPLHVTLRIRAGLPALREHELFIEVRRALVAGRERFGFRLVHFSVQRDHLHLLAEAASRRALSRGVQGLSVRVARAVNRRLQRHGKVFADRYHARALKTPRSVRWALRYVLLNVRKHERGAWGVPFGFVDVGHGLPLRGPPIAGKRVWADNAVLRAWTLRNLIEYWGPWATRLREGPSALDGQHALVCWGVLGVSRLHYTLTTGHIVSKTGAGQYALGAFEQSDRIVSEALRLCVDQALASHYANLSERRADVVDFVALVMDSALRVGAV